MCPYQMPAPPLGHKNPPSLSGHGYASGVLSFFFYSSSFPSAGFYIIFRLYTCTLQTVTPFPFSFPAKVLMMAVHSCYLQSLSSLHSRKFASQVLVPPRLHVVRQDFSKHLCTPRPQLILGSHVAHLSVAFYIGAPPFLWLSSLASRMVTFFSLSSLPSLHCWFPLFSLTC